MVKVAAIPRAKDRDAGWKLAFSLNGKQHYITLPVGTDHAIVQQWQVHLRNLVVASKTNSFMLPHHTYDWLGSLDNVQRERLRAKGLRIDAYIRHSDLQEFQQDTEFAQKQFEIANAKYLSLLGKLEQLEQHIKRKRRELVELCGKKPEPMSSEMPLVPEPECTAEMAAIHFPQSSGIYFAFEHGECVYVGKSINLRNRLASHATIKPHHDMAYIAMPEVDIHFAELYYIWLLRPTLNGEATETIRSMALCDS